LALAFRRNFPRYFSIQGIFETAKDWINSQLAFFGAEIRTLPSGGYTVIRRFFMFLYSIVMGIPPNVNVFPGIFLSSVPIEAIF
jgi:hypothetical protein